MEQARKSISTILQALQLPRSTAYDIVLALGEALGNAFDHGGGSQGQEGDALPQESLERGRGIKLKLMLMLADSISITPRSSGRGTCVRLVKMLNLEPAARA